MARRRVPMTSRILRFTFIIIVVASVAVHGCSNRAKVP
jgi:hypothetical protein